MNKEGRPSAVAALKDSYFKEVVQSVQAFREIEELIIDLDELEQLIGEGLYHTRARRFRERLHTLRIRVVNAHRRVLETIDRSIEQSHLVSLGVVLYRRKLNELGINGSDERTAAQAAFLNPAAIRTARRKEERKIKRQELKNERLSRQTEVEE